MEFIQLLVWHLILINFFTILQERACLIPRNTKVPQYYPELLCRFIGDISPDIYAIPPSKLFPMVCKKPNEISEVVSLDDPNSPAIVPLLQ
jgi:hypothetical protein